MSWIALNPVVTILSMALEAPTYAQPSTSAPQAASHKHTELMHCSALPSEPCTFLRNNDGDLV